MYSPKSERTEAVMKKIISLILAAIIAFSCAVVAFAADNTCAGCGKRFTAAAYGSADAAEKAYNEHLEKGCTFSCRFGCGAAFSIEANCKDHEKVCPEFPGSKCSDCGAEFKTYGDELAHDCDKKSDAADGAVDKVADLINKIDWEKLTDGFISIFSKIDLQKTFADLMAIFGNIVKIFQNIASKAQ